MINMNKKGFTLVELLGVIVLIAVISVIAVTSVASISNGIKKRLLEEKLEFIEKAAENYGNANKHEIINSSKNYNGNSCISIIVSNLVPEYLDKDNKRNNCLTESQTGNGCVVNPADDTKFLDTLEVIISYKNNRIHAVVDKDNNLSCS